MSFRLKTIIGIAAIEILLLGILIVSGLYYLRSSNEKELLTRAHITAQLFATMTSDAVLSMDLATLDALVEQTLKNDGIRYVRIRRGDGVVLSEGGDRQALDASFEHDTTMEGAKLDGRLDIANPILVSGEEFGRVEIGLSTDEVEKVVGEARQWMLSIAASEIILVALFGIGLGTILTRQLTKLQIGAQRVAAGEFGHQLPVRGRDELADTTVSFNQMSAALGEFAREAIAAKERAEEGREYAETVLNDALNSMPQGVVVVTQDHQVTFMNESYRRRCGSMARKVGETFDFIDLMTFTSPQVQSDGKCSQENYVKDRLEILKATEQNPEWQTTLNDGRIMMTAQQRMSDGGVVVVETDVSELFEALERNRRLEIEVLNTRKMEALGALSAGIAHEINTPIQFIGANLEFLDGAFQDVTSLLKEMDETQNSPMGAFRTKLEEIDWSFLREEIPSSLSEAMSGITTVKEIVHSVKTFSGTDTEEKAPHDIQNVIEDAIVVSRNEWKLVADIACEFEGDLTDIPCIPGKLGQVLINLIINAAQAIEGESRGSQGQILIAAKRLQSHMTIDVSDNGPGIPETIAHQIFDMFFTTKAPGQGTGQGLAICKTIIEANHGGKLSVASNINGGATFEIILPLDNPLMSLEEKRVA